MLFSSISVSTSLLSYLGPLFHKFYLFLKELWVCSFIHLFIYLWVWKDLEHEPNAHKYLRRKCQVDARSQYFANVFK